MAVDAEFIAAAFDHIWDSGAGSETIYYAQFAGELERLAAGFPGIV